MKSKKIIVAILALVIVATLAATFSGCTTKFTSEEGFDVMRKALENSLTQKTYFVKENIYNYKDESGTGTLEKRMNVHEDDAKTSINDTKVRYTDIFTKSLAMENTYYHEWSYGQSLPKAIKPKKAQDSDYKAYMFVVKDNVMTKKLTTLDEFMAIPKVNDYTIANVLHELDTLALADLTEFKAQKAGVINTCTFVVNKEGHAYHGKSMKIQSMYNKISVIESIGTGVTSEFKIDITYKGPKINIISYDDKYKEKDIADMA